MKPGFLQGFDEADRGKDVRRISVQESSALTSVRPAAPPNKGNRSSLPIRAFILDARNASRKPDAARALCNPEHAATAAAAYSRQ